MLAALALPAASGRLLETLMWKNAPEAKVPFAQVIENRSGIITVDRAGTVYGNGVYDGHFNVELTQRQQTASCAPMRSACSTRRRATC